MLRSVESYVSSRSMNRCLRVLRQTQYDLYFLHPGAPVRWPAAIGKPEGRISHE
jgi:hypothetical protein